MTRPDDAHRSATTRTAMSRAAMSRAAALTRGGKLAEATRVIQAALGRGGPSTADPSTTAPSTTAPMMTASSTTGRRPDAAASPHAAPTIDGEVVGRAPARAAKRAANPAARPAAKSAAKPVEKSAAKPGSPPRPKEGMARASDGASDGVSGHPTGGPTAGPLERLSRTLSDALPDASSSGLSGGLPGRFPHGRGGAFARTRARAKPRPASAPVPVAPGARWEWRAGPDGRRFRLYVPASLAGTGGAPLVVMLHGCTQDPDDFALGTRMNLEAERAGAVVAYPEQTRGSNAMACWNWFEPAHQGTGGEPASIAAIARAVRAELGPGRTVVAGLSAGGAMAAILGHAYPDVFAGVGIHSGLPAGAAGDLGGAQRAMSRGGRARLAARIPTIVVHGEADRTVHPANGQAAFEAVAGTWPRTERREGTASVTTATAPDGRAMAEHWRIPGLAHAWSGGDAAGSYTAPDAPDATRAMVRFLL